MDDKQSHPTPQQSEETPLNPPSEGKTKPEGFWYLVAQATTLGWNLVVPIVGGVLLGRHLDDMFHKEFTWTLSLLLMGVAVAFNNLYAMYAEHGDTKPPRKRRRKNHDLDKESENHAKDK